MGWIKKLFGKEDSPFEIYKADGYPCVYLAQPRAEALAKRAGLICGVLVFMDEIDGKVALHIALVPADGGRKDALIAHLHHQNDISLGEVGFAKLPKPERERINQNILAIDSHNMSLFAKEQARQKPEKDENKLLKALQARVTALSKSDEEHNLVFVDADDDDARLSKTIRFLEEKGYLSRRTAIALGEVMKELPEWDLNDRTRLQNIKLRLAQTYAGIKVARGLAAVQTEVG